MWCYWVTKIEYQLVWRYHWRYGCVLPRFYTNPPINSQNDRVWSQGEKSNVMASRLLVQRVNFAPHIMVSAGVSFKGKGRLRYTSSKKRQRSTPIDNLLPKLVEYTHFLLGNNFDSSRMVHRHMGRWERKSGLANIARTSLTRIRGRQTARI